MSEFENIVTIKQAAEQLNVHTNTIRNWIKAGKLPAYRLGVRLVRIRREDLINFSDAYKAGNE